MIREEADNILLKAVVGRYPTTYNGADVIQMLLEVFNDKEELEEKLKAKDDEIELLKCRIKEAMKPKTCQECKWWDRTRPRSHPNYAECNNRNCPISYEEVIYTFGCNMYEPKDNA